MTRPAASLFVALVAAMVPAADPPRPKANKLAGESSPYLLQHAHNPVDWHPWGPEAFALAQKEGKLVFLSIGYSSCHWCHVMEKESFSDADIAKVLNENFVCIKVDREERPDIDDVYMTALSVTGVSGGWPLTMFLTPDGKPIFGGTYFPPVDKGKGEDVIPGLPTVLKRVTELHKDKKKELFDQADTVAKMTEDGMNRAALAGALVPLEAKLVSEAAGEFEFDPEYGGLGRKLTEYRGAKFPRAAALQFLLKQSAKPGQEDLAKHMTRTLDQLARGGICDHLGGGFHRYSTERTWTVPHFEKMLYDQAQLVELYAEAYRLKANPEYKRVIDETLAFVARELTAEAGYFYSALDADSDGEEGRFYVWTPKDLDAALEKEADADLFRAVYGVGDKPNFEKKYHILRLTRLPTDGEWKKLAPLRAKLFDRRAKRTRPFLDTKLITAWNGQMIAAYALAGQVLKEPKYTAAAEKAADFLLKTMTDKDGRLIRIYAAKPGDKPAAKGAAFLDDYAYLAHGLLALHDATGEKKWLTAAADLTAKQRKWYGDDKGGYYNTASDGEKLFARGRDSYDGAQPSANGMAVRNGVRLWQKLKTEELRARAEADLKRLAGLLQQQPTSVPVAADALDTLLAAGGLKAGGEAKVPDPPKNPKDSSDVVTVELSPFGLADGLESFNVGLTVAKGWHVYANPPGNKDLAASATVVEFFVDGKPVKYQDIKYPKGTRFKDQSGAEYDVYEGKMGWLVWLSHDETSKGKVTVKVRVIACDSKTCLKPSTVKAEAK